MKIRLTTLVAIASFTMVFGADPVTTAATDSTVKVLVLIPFDEIANAGVSPDTQRMIEKALAKQDELSVIPFPFKTLMGVPYQMVFDKRYCKPILEKVDCDVIIMTRIITDNEREPGTWPWSYKIRVYNARTGKQLDSIHGENLKSENIEEDILSKIEKLTQDIELTFISG
jgi:hypothetical protein